MTHPAHRLSADNVTYGTLPPHEWERLEILRRYTDEPWPNPEKADVITAEVGGELVGTISVESALYASLFWVDERLRGEGMAEELFQRALKLAAPNTLGLAAATNPHAELLIFKAGFMPVRGTLFRKVF